MSDEEHEASLQSQQFPAKTESQPVSTPILIGGIVVIALSVAIIFIVTLKNRSPKKP